MDAQALNLVVGPPPRPWRFRSAVALLLVVLAVELVVPARRQSPVFDEGCHILAGYRSWTHADFGVNPEHPPLVKLLATVPLLGTSLNNVPSAKGFFKLAEFAGGRQFLYSNNADLILFRVRMAAATLTVLAALLVFVAAYEMFGATPALLSLLLFVFEPNLIAHGALVTTDMGMTSFLLATVFAFYRYIKEPSAARLAVTCLAVGLCVAAKHSGILWVPILSLLALSEVIRNDASSGLAQGGRTKLFVRLAKSLIVVGAVSVAILWAFYGFKFQARPAGQALVPAFHEYVKQIGHPRAQQVISTLAHYHVLPESYLYGFTDVMIAPRYVTPYLFGKVYPSGRWFYPPATFVIKATLGFLLLLLALPISLALRRAHQWRELRFLTIPPAVYCLAAVMSGFSHGIRYLLPVFPFLLILAAFAAWRLAQVRKAWRYSVSALVVFHVVSSVRAFPDYLPYSNELWGGPANTYKVLSDSNVDWGQQLKITKKYLDQRGIKDCWFDYFGRTAADPGYYGIPCKPLPDAIESAFGIWAGDVPSHVEGTVLISDNELSGNIWGPGELNPYAQFQKMRPDDSIAGGIFVFRGQFYLPLAAATSHAQAASTLLQDGKLSDAWAEARSAVLLAPGDVESEVALGDILMRLNRKDEAIAAYERAVFSAQNVYPEFQGYWAAIIKQKMNR